MKKIIYFLALLLSTVGIAEERPYFFYGDAHTMGGYPMVGVGIRSQKGIHAFDFSGNICPLNAPGSFNLFQLKSLYLIYPGQKGFYFGEGLGFLNEPETVKLSVSAEFAIGYQWKNRIFFEGNATVPFKHIGMFSPVWPGLTLGFGF